VKCSCSRNAPFVDSCSSIGRFQSVRVLLAVQTQIHLAACQRCDRLRFRLVLVVASGSVPWGFLDFCVSLNSYKFL
jgi:hypothetical protein